MVKKTLILAEVSLILVLFLFLRGVLKSSGFGDWQEPLFGASILSSCLLFFVLPLTALIVTRRDPRVYGLTSVNLSRHLRLALRAIAVVMPATFLFPVIALLGSDHQHWLGASILAVGFAAAAVVMLLYTRRTVSIPETRISIRAFFGGYVGLLIAGVALCYVVHPISQLITRIVIVLIFVAFLEEFFFRGYVQTRLNEAFGRPYSLFNVNCGAGLVVAAIIFGLFHPLSVANATPWAWALWAATGGLIFGFLREKSGAVVVPTLVHGAIQGRCRAGSGARCDAGAKRAVWRLSEAA
jgi:membrane protease YdiL (CAAX protease family)